WTTASQLSSYRAATVEFVSTRILAVDSTCARSWRARSPSGQRKWPPSSWSSSTSMTEPPVSAAARAASRPARPPPATCTAGGGFDLRAQLACQIAVGPTQVAAQFVVFFHEHDRSTGFSRGKGSCHPGGATTGDQHVGVCIALFIGVCWPFVGDDTAVDEAAQNLLI